MDTKYTLKRKYKTSTLDNKVIAKQRKKDIDLNTMTKKTTDRANNITERGACEIEKYIPIK